MLIPIGPVGHENAQVQRQPMVTIGLIAISLFAFLLSVFTFESESPELAQTRMLISMLAAAHPELSVPPAAQRLAEESRRHTGAGAAGNQGSQTASNAGVQGAESTASLQQEMDSLTARYDVLRPVPVLERYSFIPAQRTWYSYVTANLFSAGFLQLLVNGWFLWLAGVALEEVWGRRFYLAVYLIGGAFALQVYSWCNAGSHMSALGATGAIAALMGGLIVRFPKARIEMIGVDLSMLTPSKSSGGKRFSLKSFEVKHFSVETCWLVLLWLVVEILSGLLLGAKSGVAHMAHLGGGFSLGILAGVGIRSSGREHAITKIVSQEVVQGFELDQIQRLITQNREDNALVGLDRFIAAHPESVRALRMQQEIQWRRVDLSAYANVTQRLCAVYLGLHDTDEALKVYEDLVQKTGDLLPAETWFKLGQALEKQKQYERALGEYQELADAYPMNRCAPLALLSGARLAMEKMQRPQHAINLYQAAAESEVPHLELDANIEMGVKQARAALEEIAKEARKAAPPGVRSTF